MPLVLYIILLMFVLLPAWILIEGWHMLSKVLTQKAWWGRLPYILLTLLIVLFIALLLLGYR